MKITSIKLAGFRSHVKTLVADLGRVNIFVGPNGAGKSTILDAIGFALTGVTRGCGEDGRGAEALACQLPATGKTSTSVSLQTDKGEIIRGLGQGPRSQAHVAIVTKLGLDQRILRVLQAPMNLLRLPSKKQEEIFFSMTGSAVTVEAVGAALTEAGIDLEATPVDLDELLTPEGRSAKLTFWKQRRVEMKREIESLVFTPSEQELPPADAEKRAKLEEQAKALADKIARAQGAGDKARQSQQHFDELIADASAAVDNLKKVQNAKLVATSDIKRWRAQIDEVHAWREDAAKKNAEFTAASNAKDKIRVEADRIKALGRECSQCGQAIDKAAADKKIATMRTEYDELSKSVLGISGKVKEIGDKIAKVDVNALLTQINQAERVADDNKKNADALTKAQKTLDDYKRRRDDIEIPEGQDLSKEEAKLADMHNHINLLRVAENEEERQAAVNRKRSDIVENLEAMEKMLKAVGPGGAIQQAMAGAGTDEMVEIVRSIAAKLGVGDVGIKFGPWQITLNGRDIELASASEEFRVAAAFGMAFAKKAGASIVMLDGAEILRGDNRGLFQDLLFSCELEQIFVAFASDSIPESSEAADGLAMFSVEKGNNGASSVRAIKQEVAA